MRGLGMGTGDREGGDASNDTLLVGEFVIPRTANALPPPLPLNATTRTTQFITTNFIKYIFSSSSSSVSHTSFPPSWNSILYTCSFDCVAVYWTSLIPYCLHDSPCLLFLMLLLLLLICHPLLLSSVGVLRPLPNLPSILSKVFHCF